MELAPNPARDGAYLYRREASDFPRVVRYAGGRWYEAAGPRRGRTLDRPQFWCAIPALSQWTAPAARVAA